MNDDALILVDSLEFSHPSPRKGGLDACALSIERLSILEGERVAIVGPNGSGKTTLLKLLARLLLPSKGSVEIAPRPGERRPTRRAVYLHQDPYVLAGSVSYNVAFGARARGMTAAEAAEAGKRALESLGLGGYEKRRHFELSGGEARRVALARAIATGADVFLLDEPTSQADSASDAMLRAALEALARGGATLVFATHDESFREAFAERTIRLDRGKTLEEERS